MARPDAEQVKLLRDALISEAKGDGEDHPHCRDPRGYAESAGNFTRYGASRPPGASAPQGTWLSVWLSADSIRPKKLNLTDLGLGGGDSSLLETCGPWMPLDLGSD